jgi:hypothetical protein
MYPFFGFVVGGVWLDGVTSFSVVPDVELSELSGSSDDGLVSIAPPVVVGLVPLTKTATLIQSPNPSRA